MIWGLFLSTCSPTVRRGHRGSLTQAEPGLLDRLPPRLSLGPLVGKVKEYQVETIVDALCANMRSDKEQLRDIAGIGLKTVLSELPPAATGTQGPGTGCVFYLS